MNRTLLVALPALLLVGACTAARPPGAGAPAGCKPPQEDKGCSRATRVNINLQAAGGPEAAPECITVSRGETVKVYFTPRPAAAGTVVTIPEDAADGWLLGSNGTGGADVDAIHLEVPADAGLGHYKYTVLSDKGACLDPRVHVER